MLGLIVLGVLSTIVSCNGQIPFLGGTGSLPIPFVGEAVKVAGDTVEAFRQPAKTAVDLAFDLNFLRPTGGSPISKALESVPFVGAFEHAAESVLPIPNLGSSIPSAVAQAAQTASAVGGTAVNAAESALGSFGVNPISAAASIIPNVAQAATQAATAVGTTALNAAESAIGSFGVNPISAAASVIPSVAQTASAVGSTAVNAAESAIGSLPVNPISAAAAVIPSAITSGASSSSASTSTSSVTVV